MDVTTSQDHHVAMNESEKIDKYLELAEKAQTKNHVKVEISPIIIGAMGMILQQLKYQTSKEEHRLPYQLQQEGYWEVYLASKRLSM